MPVDILGCLKFLWIWPLLFGLFYSITIYRFLSVPLFPEFSSFWDDNL